MKNLSLNQMENVEGGKQYSKGVCYGQLNLLLIRFAVIFAVPILGFVTLMLTFAKYHECVTDFGPR